METGVMLTVSMEVYSDYSMEARGEDIWNPYSIVCLAYISLRYMSDTFQILTYVRYIPGIYLHAKCLIIT